MYSNNIYDMLNKLSNYINSVCFSDLLQSDCVNVGMHDLGIIPK